MGRGGDEGRKAVQGWDETSWVGQGEEGLDGDEARLQLRQALSHCSQDREELDRLRKMLQQEREAAQRREREIEELQVGVGAGVRVEV